MRTSLIIPAAGVGKRFSSKIKKQFYQIDGKPVLYFTLKNMLSFFPFSEVILGVNAEDAERTSELYKEIGSETFLILAPGGETRAETVMNCINAASGDILVVHDAVRPFANKNDTKAVIDKAAEKGAAICALKVRDTVKYVKEGVIKKTVSREGLYLAHTPQAFQASVIRNAMQKALEDKQEITDEASACEAAGYNVEISPSSYENIKITYTDDMEMINILKAKHF